MTPPALSRISDFAAHWARHRPDGEAVVLRDVRWTHAELGRRVDAMARALLAAGVGRGDRVALLSPPHPDFWVGFLASASIGAIWLGLNPRHTRDELQYVLSDAEPGVVLARTRLGSRDYRDDLAALRTAVPGIRRLVVLGGDPLPEGAEAVEAFLAMGHAILEDALEAARERVTGADPALIVYTSGTTGRPKGALLPHRGLVRCSLVQAATWPAEPLRVLNNLPINHIGCVGDLACYALVGGGTQVFMEGFEPDAILPTLARERVTVWGQIPAMFTLTLAGREAQRSATDLSSLQWIVWSGSAAPRDLARELLAICPRVALSYGMTETVGSITYASGITDLDILSETIGWPAPAYEVRVARPDGTAADLDEPGEIQTRGEHIMLGYWRRPGATAETIDATGWLHTGDIGVRQANGTIRLVGRMREVFKSGGYNIYPREVELALEAHPLVRLAAVLGVPDPVYGEVGHAFVMPRPGTHLTAEVLRQHCRERLANYKVPKSFTIADELPLLPVGKIDKQALRAATAGTRLSPPPASPPLPPP